MENSKFLLNKRKGIVEIRRSIRQQILIFEIENPLENSALTFDLLLVLRIEDLFLFVFTGLQG